MTIVSETYALGRLLKETDWRLSIASLIRELTYTKDGEANRSHFDYLARRYRAQLLGYLLVDQNRAKLESGRPVALVPPLTSDERKLLHRSYYQLECISRECVAPIVESLPALASALDPYHRWRRHVKCRPEAPFLSSDCTRPLVDAFRCHPAVDTIFSAVKALSTTEADQAQYSDVVEALYQRLKRVGPRKVPRGYDDVALWESDTSRERLSWRLAGALLCVRSSLEALNQLLFQALLDERLVLFDGNNVIQAQSGWNLASRWLAIQAVYVRCGRVNREGEIVLVHLPQNTLEQPAPFQIDRYREDHSYEVGFTDEYEMRALDEYLNPYPGILHHL